MSVYIKQNGWSSGVMGSSRTVLSPAFFALLAATQLQVPKTADGIAQLLAKAAYPAVATALRTSGSKSLAALGADGAALIKLRLPALRGVLAAMAAERGGRAQGPIETQLRTLLMSHRGNPVPAYLTFVGYLDKDKLRLAVLPHVGRGALQLCRSGNPGALAVLKKITELYKGQAWAISNLANAQRFLGRYGEAIKLYEGQLESDGRDAWTLNSLGLCYQAQGQREKALALYLEGAAKLARGQVGDKDSCRSNAALLLWQAGGQEKRLRALRLLSAVKDPMATRVRYWQRQIEREGSRQSSRR